ncbi:helix-turn-helix domain-containing protein [Niallia alba]|uniref:helix-turn-helix domain-containing protein n=1 Tax=Niallia alba TaxID=2729105 RepID=UPI0039A3A47A
MSFIKILILNCLYKMNGERTIYSILHILNGKKSSQTIQDIHIFQLTSLFQAFPVLTREKLDQVVYELIQEDWLEKTGENHYLIKECRKLELDKLLKANPLSLHLKGWRYHSYTLPFWERLSLFVQVSSHLSEKSIRYMPVQRNLVTQLWLKDTLHTVSLERSEINHYLYQELVKCLEEEELNPSILINRLTGIHRIGLTGEQVALELNMDPDYYHLSFLAILHFMIEKILSNKEEYPLLSQLIKESKKPFTLTESTAKTFDFIQKGYSIDDIVVVRNLKQSTIEDHIIEILLNVPNYPIRNLVSNENIIKIKACIQQSSSKSLKVIKQQLSDVSYFEIRAVMAGYGDFS